MKGKISGSLEWREVC